MYVRGLPPWLRREKNGELTSDSGRGCAPRRRPPDRPGASARSSTLRNDRLVRSFENHLGDAGVVGAIGGANHQKVLSGGEARQIEGKLLALGIDNAVHRFHGHPTVGVERVFAAA